MPATQRTSGKIWIRGFLLEDEDFTVQPEHAETERDIRLFRILISPWYQPEIQTDNQKANILEETQGLYRRFYRMD